MSADPTRIRSIAVKREDLVQAVELARTTDKPAVLRVTPPFSGRMRARLHVETPGEYDEKPAPVHVDPDDLVADSCPPYPRPADTEDELRADPDESYSVERHHERHTEAVQAWREQVPHEIVERVALDAGSDRHEVSVTLLGAPE